MIDILLFVILVFAVVMIGVELVSDLKKDIERAKAELNKTPEQKKREVEWKRAVEKHFYDIKHPEQAMLRRMREMNEKMDKLIQLKECRKG